MACTVPSESVLTRPLTFEFAPLQLAPALVGGVMYWLRARTLRGRGPPCRRGGSGAGTAGWR